MKKFIRASSSVSSAAIDTINAYLAQYGHYAEVIDTWETDDGVYALIDEYGRLYVLRYANGHIYNVNNDDVEILARKANQ